MSSSSNRSKRKSLDSPNFSILTSKPKTKPQNHSIPIQVKSEKHDNDNVNVNVNVNVSISSDTPISEFESHIASIRAEVELESESTLPNEKSRFREKYAAAALLVKKSVVASLISKDCSDIGFMSKLAQAGFESFESLESDFSDFHRNVNNFIYHKIKLQDAEIEIEKSGLFSKDLISRLDLVISLSLEAAKELGSARAELSEARARAVETRKLLEEIEASVETLGAKVKRLEESLVAEFENIA